MRTIGCTYRILMEDTCTRLLRTRLYCLLLSLLAIPFHQVLAQEHEFVNYDVDEGLPSPWVTASYQDSSGRLWFATSRRVVKFDGYDFKQLLPLDSNETPWVWNIEEGPNGVPWLLSAQATLYKVVGNTPIPHPANDTLITLFGNLYRHTFLGFGTGDTILIGFNSRSFYAKVAPDGRVEKIDLTKWQDKGLIRVMTQGDVCLGSSVGRHETSTETIIKVNNRLYPVKNHPTISKTLVEKAKPGEIIVANGKNVYKINQKGIVNELLIDKDIVDMHVDRDMNIWLSLGAQVECWSANLEHKLFTCLRSEFCNTIFQDDEGSMWFGTRNGVFRMINQNITHLNEFDDTKIANPNPPEFVGKDSVLWLMSENRLISLKNGHLETLPYATELGRTKDDRLDSVYIRSRQGIFQKGGNTLFRISPAGIYNGHIYEPDGSFWTLKGINLLRIDVDQKVLFNAQESGIDWVQPKIMNTFGELHFKDAEGHLWMTLGTKLYTFNGTKLNLVDKRYKKYELKYVLDAIENNGVVWVTTTSQGLWALYPDSFAHFTEHNGLQSAYNTEVFIESPTCIWAAGLQGLTRIEYTFENGVLKATPFQLNKNKGLKTSNIKNGVSYEGAMWFTSRHGITKLDAKRWASQECLLPPPNITAVRVNDQPRDKQDPSVLAYDRNNIAIHFKNITFKGREHPVYTYRLLGADSTWHSTVDTSVQYSGLQPGKYQFQVNVAGNGTSSSYSFEISLPFWRKWWFVLISILTIQLTTLSIVWVVSRFKKRTLASEKNALIAEVKALRLQVNPHFMFNALNNIRELVNQGEQTEAPQQILHFSQLMRKVLNASQKERISLADEIDLIRSYFSFAKARFQDKVKYNVHISAEVRLMEEVVSIPPLITQPIIENALVHGASKANGIGTIEVRFNRLENHIRCQIIDNGPGFSPHKSTSENGSIGMSLVKDQIEKINASRKLDIHLSIFSGAEWNKGNGGTCVQLDLPIEG